VSEPPVESAATLRRAVRAARSGWQMARFRAWAARLDIELRRRGGRLELDAPHGLAFEEPPLIRARAIGEGGGVFTLRLGRGITIGRRCAIEIWAGADNLLEIGDDTLIEDDVKLHLFGGRIRVGPESQLRDFVRFKTQGDLTLGRKVVLGYLTMLHCSERIELHDYAGLSERVTVVDSDHGFDGSDEYFFDAPLKSAPIVLERNSFCASGTTIMRGTHLGRNSVVGSGAVVPKGDYPAGWLMVGMPAKPLKPLPATVAAGTVEPAPATPAEDPASAAS
jgi:acetyltransferase-like isoleucine patch superfamily enzyme